MTEGAGKPRILFYFLHLLGVGHIYRAKRLIEGFMREEIAVDVIYGGEPVPGIQFDAESIHYLPPIRAADNAYSHYLDADGEVLGDTFVKMRTEKLLEIFEGLQPDLILTEAFPFGRRMVRDEMEALLNKAKQREHSPLIVSSVRDILQERKKPGRVEETRNWIDSFFDHILVHSDPAVIKLDATFPLANTIKDKLHYTGFVVPDEGPEVGTQPFDRLVSAGGGAFGGALLTIALEAARGEPNCAWCISTGPNLPKDQAEFLKQNAPSNVTVVTRLENLTAHMRDAGISISQCGYNTAMDALAAHRDSNCQAVFVPYDTDGQTEQLRRAELLQEAGYAISVPQSELTAERLIQAIRQATSLPKSIHPADFGGVTSTARLVRGWLDKRQASI